MMMPGIIAAQGAGSAAVVTRQYYSAEEPGTIDGSDYTLPPVELVALTFTPDADSDYLIIWTCELNAGATTFNGTVAAIQEDGVEIDRVIYTAGTDTGTWSERGAFYIHQAGPAPDPVTFSLGCKHNSAGSSAAKARNGRILALKLTDDDVWVEDTGDQSTTSSSPVDAVTLNFTPPSAGSYLILGLGILNTGVAENGLLRLNDGTNVTPSREYIFGGAADTIPGINTWWRKGLTSAQTISLQYWITTVATLTMRSARIVALRLSGFTHAYLKESGVDESGTEASFTDSLVVSRTVGDKDFLALAAFNVGRSASSTHAMGGQFADYLGEVNEADQTVLTGTCMNPFFSARIGAYPAGRREWAIQRRQPPFGGSSPVIKEGALIAVLQLN